jgi:hypothetical protein
MENDFPVQGELPVAGGILFSADLADAGVGTKGIEHLPIPVQKFDVQII